MLSHLFANTLHLINMRLFQFAMVAAVFIPLERLIPFHPKQRLFRRQFLIDLLHYFVGGLFIIAFVRMTYSVMPTLASWTHLPPSPITVKHLPWWQQVLLFEAASTFLGYWVHRYEHINPVLWRLHSIHESTEELDWLSAFRLHPLEPALFQILTVVPLWYLGMSLPVARWYKIYSYIFAHVQHSNVVFPIGPLKYIFPTPQFHRWHHARVIDANGKQVRSFRNFAEYPIWDILFGTFYLPDEKPTAYGNARSVPMDYIAQLAYPFRAHGIVLAWKRAISEHLRLSDRFVTVRSAMAHGHEAFENDMAKLCLLRPAEPAMPSLMAMHAILGKEDA
jgi:sterol desaturase/sphingolipid hydroxylase (fatty acid hydroxylase superfamily)